MATAENTIRRAFLLAGITAVGEALSADESEDGLQTLNEMLHSWALKGIDLGHTDLDLTDELAVPDEYLMAIRYNLAVALSPEYQVPVKPEILAIAQTELARLHIDNVVVGDVELEPGLTATGERYNILND